MNVFEDFNKQIVGGSGATVNIFNSTNSKIVNFFETDDCIYLDGTPCDKYTLSPITFYKDKPLMNISTAWYSTSPITNTRYFNRNIGDGNKMQYRTPYAPKQTLQRNNARLSNQDEVIITGFTSPSASSARGNSALYYDKATNKIIKAFMVDLLNFKPSIFALDDSRYISPTNAYGNNTDCGLYGAQDCQLTLFNKDTNAITNYPISDYGYIHNILARTLSGDILFLYSTFTGGAPYPSSSGNHSSGSIFTLKKFNKATLTISDVLSTTTGNNIAPLCEPAINNDNTEIYFVNTVSQASSAGTEMRYTINKYKIDPNAGTASLVPLTINLNGLASYLKGVMSSVNYTNYYNYSNAYGYNYFNGTNYDYNSPARSCLYGGIKLSYLELGGNKYLVATSITNKAPVNSGVEFYQCAYNDSITRGANDRSVPTSDDNMNSGNYQYSMMYLFKITGDTLKLVDAKQTYGTAVDTPQAVFPVNNNTGLVFIRYAGLDIVTIDTINDKFLLQDVINEQIYSLGIDDLERIWYTTSTDAIVNDIKLKVFTVGSATLIDTNFETTNFAYNNADIPSNITVSAKQNAGGYVAVNVQLLLEGNAVFAANGTKSINVTTSATGAIQVPITIKGDGIINVYTNILTS